MVLYYYLYLLASLRLSTQIVWRFLQINFNNWDFLLVPAAGSDSNWHLSGKFLNIRITSVFHNVASLRKTSSHCLGERIAFESHENDNHDPKIYCIRSLFFIHFSTPIYKPEQTCTFPAGLQSIGCKCRSKIQEYCYKFSTSYLFIIDKFPSSCS